MYPKSANGFEVHPIQEFVNDMILLYKYTMYADEFAELDYDTQKEMYSLCQIHANLDVCKENLKQIRYAVTRLYFSK